MDDFGTKLTRMGKAATITMLSLLLSTTSFAAPAALTYQGRILKTDGTPLEHSAVSFIFQIVSPSGSCVVYQEQVTGYDMTNSNGVFDVPIGTGTLSFPLSGGFSILDSFNNSSTFNCASCTGYTCTNGSSTYTPLVDDGRILRVQFHDGTGWRKISPDNVIRSVPYAAYSLAAQKLGNNVASDFLLKAGLPTCGGGTFLTWNGSSLTCGSLASSDIPNFDWSKISSGKPTTLSGYGITDSLVKNGGGVGTVSSGTDAAKPSSPGNGDLFVASDTQKIYRFNGSSWDLMSSAAGSGGTVTSVSSANADIAVATGSTTPLLTLNTGTAANQILKLDATAKIPAVDGSQITNLHAAQIPNISATKITSGVLAVPQGGTGQSTYTDGQILIGNSATSSLSKATLTAGSGVSIINGNGSVTISATGSGGTVTNVSGLAPLTVATGTSTPVVSLSNGSQAGQVYRWDGTSAWVASKLGYMDLVNSASVSPWPSSSCTAGQAVVWSSVADGFTCANLSIATSQLTGTLAAAQIPAFSGDVTSSAGFTTLTLASSGVTAGTYKSVTVDAKGRVTSGTNPTTLSGYGISDAVKNSGGVGNISAGLDASKPGTPSTGDLFVATDTQKIYRYNGASWDLVSSAGGSGGTITSVTAGSGLSGGGSSGAVTLNVNAGTAANQIVQLDASAKLPSVDGSQLTNLQTSQIPNLSAAKITSGVLAVPQGGTGQSNYTDGQLLIGNTATSGLSKATLTAGSGVSITNGNGSVTISATGSGGTVTNVTGSSPINVTLGSTTPAISLANGSAAGQVYRWNGTTAWIAAKLGYMDLVNSASLSPWPSSTCTTGQAVVWSSVADGFTCSSLSIATSQLTGTLAAAQMPAFSGDVTSAAGSTTLTLANSGATAGTYKSVTVDSKGRVTAGTNPSTLSGYGISDAVRNAGGVGTMSAGTDSAKPGSPAAGDLFVATDTQKIYRYNGSSWDLVSSAGGSGGTVTSITAGTGLSGGTITGSGTIGLGTELTAVNGVSTTGFLQRTGAGAYSTTSASVAASANTLALRDAGGVSNFYGLGLSGTTSGIVNIQTPATVTSYALTLPSAQGASGQMLVNNGSGVLSWATPAATTLADAKIWVGQSGTPTAVAPTGDISMTNAGAFTVNKIGGVGLSASPTLSGQVLRYDGANWTPNFVSMQDLRSKVTGTTALASTCSASQTLTYNSVGDNLTCSNIAITDSQITYGSQSAKTFLAAPTGASGAPTFRTIASTDLPTTGATGLYINGGNAFGSAATLGTTDAYSLGFKTGGTTRMTLDTSGNVGIGTASPAYPLDVTGMIHSTSVSVGSNALAITQNGWNFQFGAHMYQPSSYVAGFGVAPNSSNQVLIQGTTTDNSKAALNVQNSAASPMLYVRNDSTVGFGTASPRSAVDISSGSVTFKAAVSNGTSTVDFSSGNLQYTTNSCGSFQLNNMKDGGSYTFVVKGASSTTCSFTAYSDAGSTSLTVHMPTDLTATTASKHTLFTYLVMGGDVYVSWMPGL